MQELFDPGTIGPILGIAFYFALFIVATVFFGWFMVGFVSSIIAFIMTVFDEFKQKGNVNPEAPKLYLVAGNKKGN